MLTKNEAKILIALVEFRAPRDYNPQHVQDLQNLGHLSKYGRVTTLGLEALGTWAGLSPWEGGS